jgi:hypothetical protein
MILPPLVIPAWAHLSGQIGCSGHADGQIDSTSVSGEISESQRVAEVTVVFRIGARFAGCQI